METSPLLQIQATLHCTHFLGRPRTGIDVTGKIIQPAHAKSEILALERVKSQTFR
jgi:hypothetical protein